MGIKEGKLKMKAPTRYENLEFDTLRGIDKAAILVNYLGREAIKVLFNKMEKNKARPKLHGNRF